MSYIDNLYIYTFERRNKNYTLQFQVGQSGTRSYTNVSMNDEMINLEGEFVADFDENVPIGMEKQRALEIEFDLDKIKRNNDVNFDASNLITAIIEGTNVSPANRTKTLSSSQTIDFGYENRIVLKEDSTIVFEGVQNITTEKKAENGKFKAVFSCIASKCMTYLTPLYDNFNLTYDPVDSPSLNDWYESNTRVVAESFFKFGSRLFYWEPIAPVEGRKDIVSHTTDELRTEFILKLTELLWEYRSATGGNIYVDDWFSHVKFYRSTNDNGTQIASGPLAAYGTEVTSSELRYITRINSDGVDAKYGLLGEEDSIVSNYDNLYEFYRDLISEYLAKSVVEYGNDIYIRNSPALGKVTPSLGTANFDSNACKRIIYEPNSLIYDYGKIKLSDTTNKNGATNTISRLGNTNNDAIDNQIYFHNQLIHSGELENKRGEIGGVETNTFRVSYTPVYGLFYSAQIDNITQKYVLFKVSEYCRIYYNDTNYKETPIGSSITDRQLRLQDYGLGRCLNEVASELFYNDNQVYFEVNIPVDLINLNELGRSYTFFNLTDIIDNSELISQLPSTFIITSISWDFSDYYKVGFYGV